MNPIPVSDLEIAFPASIEKLMPKYEDIPKEFKRGDTKWNKIMSTWFFSGLKKFDPKPKNGIDVKMAIRHLKAILGSYEPKHEHKEAAVAYLMSKWFEDAEWESFNKTGDLPK